MALSLQGPSPHTAQDVAIPRGLGRELVEDSILALSPVAQGQTLHQGRATGSVKASAEQRGPLPFELRGLEQEGPLLAVWSQPLVLLPVSMGGGQKNGKET